MMCRALALGHPALFAALTGVQVGAALTASAAVVPETGPARLAFLRYAIAVLLLLPVAWAPLRQNRPAIARRDLLPIAALGMGQFGALIWFLNIAIVHAAPARVALVFATLPAVTAGVTWAVGQGRPDWPTLLGVAASLAGIACLVGVAALAGPALPTEPLGLALAFAATLTGAICSVLYRPYLVRYGILRVSVIAMLASLVPLALLTLPERATPVTSWTALAWALIAFVGASSAAGYLMWLLALRGMAAAKVTAFLALSPVTAALLSWAFLAVPLTAADVLAFGFIATGLAVVATLESAPARPYPKEPMWSRRCGKRGGSRSQ